MRINEVMDRADRMRPNSVHPDDKRRYLWNLEATIAEMMEVEAPEWDDESDYELLLPDTYSTAYVYNLMGFIDYAQEEIDLYQADMMMANQSLSEAQAWFRRNHREIGNTKFKGVFI